MGIKPRSYGRAARALNDAPSLQPPHCSFWPSSPIPCWSEFLFVWRLLTLKSTFLLNPGFRFRGRIVPEELIKPSPSPPTPKEFGAWTSLQGTPDKRPWPGESLEGRNRCKKRFLCACLCPHMQEPSPFQSHPLSTLPCSPLRWTSIHTTRVFLALACRPPAVVSVSRAYLSQ